MTDWIVNIVNSLGYGGIAFLMFLENLFPPIPSEIIMPLAGFAVNQGKIEFPYVVLAGVIGSIAGTLPWYYAGKFFGRRRLERLADKYGKWLTLSARDVGKASYWFHKQGNKAVLFCRLIPGVRTYISIPAGIEEMHLLPFLFFSLIGTTLWTSLLTYAGYLLGQNYHLVKEYLSPISAIVIVTLVIFLGIWIIRRRK
ncbi:DedA family protein [Pleurocapsales cyanobacterium LEGE 06147]|nr:DedA family protein [Pleurocapsales cyanobacterium LEGE 06147]